MLFYERDSCRSNYRFISFRSENSLDPVSWVMRCFVVKKAVEISGMEHAVGDNCTHGHASWIREATSVPYRLTLVIILVISMAPGFIAFYLYLCFAVSSPPYHQIPRRVPKLVVSKTSFVSLRPFLSSHL